MSNIIETKFAALTSSTSSAAIITGKVRPMVSAAVKALSTGFAGVELQPDSTGFIRSLSGIDGLFGQKFTGDARIHAVNFLATETVSQALDLSHLTLDMTNPIVDEIPNGTRVLFNQTVTVADGQVLPVRGATVHIAMDKAGKIYNVSSTMKHGRVLSIKGICTEAEAIAMAKTKFARLVKELSKTAGPDYAAKLKSAIKSCTHTIRLVASENAGRLDPVYEVTLSTNEPRQHMEFLVKAKTGKVVYYQSKMHFSVSSQKQRTALGRIAAKTFLKIPDPKIAINKQVVDFYVENLPDPKVLANERYTMLTNEGGNWVPVTAQADGTFNFSPAGKEQDKFSAVVAFIALNLQSEINEAWGLKKQTQSIKVFINDPSDTNNAYFDPQNYEIHTLKGTGVDKGGLTEMIGWDLGVIWHENRHHQVYLQTPAHDLPGQEGGACNEATADVHGQLMMEYMFALMFGKITKQTLTVQDIVNDKRIIGMYALPPNGIRSQRNTKTVADKDGEVHDDGEIVGGAMADSLQAFVESADVASGKVSLQDKLAEFGKNGQLLLSLAPTRNVSFSDWLHCSVTADGQLTGGANRAVIEKAFAAHGITAAGNKTPKGKGRKTHPKSPSKHPKAPKSPTKHPKSPTRRRKAA